MFPFAALSTVLIVGFASWASAADTKPVKPAKGEKQGRILNAAVKNVDAVKNSITVTVKDSDQTFALGKDAKILLKGKETGTLADIKPESRIALMLSEDMKTVFGIKVVTGDKSNQLTNDAAVKGQVKSVDAAKGTVTVAAGKKGTVLDQTLPLAKDARIAVGENKNASLGDIKPGMQAAFTLSDDKKTIIAIKAIAKEKKKTTDDK